MIHAPSTGDVVKVSSVYNILYSKKSSIICTYKTRILLILVFLAYNMYNKST